MPEFFRGWKRKVGCVTLVVACAFMAAWVRSQRTTDELIFPGKLLPQCKSRIIFYSTDQGFETEIQWSENVGANYALKDGHFQSYPTSMRSIWVSSMSAQIDTTKSFLGFAVREGRMKHNGKVRIWIVPYWSIILPFTLLSAWLLLSKPRSPKSVPTPEPQATQG